MIEMRERHRPGGHDPVSLLRDPPGSPGDINNNFFFHKQDISVTSHGKS